MDKPTALRRVIDQMRASLVEHQRAADEARAGATDQEVKSESKYDTRGLESSYLARGHAMKFESLGDDLAALESFTLPDIAKDQPACIGALIQLTIDTEEAWFFILPKGGGIEIVQNGFEITVVTPDSPIATQLCGKKTGEEFSTRPSGPKGRILSIR